LEGGVEVEFEGLGTEVLFLPRRGRLKALCPRDVEDEDVLLADATSSEEGVVFVEPGGEARFPICRSKWAAEGVVCKCCDVLHVLAKGFGKKLKRHNT
jgi:hypothetical protein